VKSSGFLFLGLALARLGFFNHKGHEGFSQGSPCVTPSSRFTHLRLFNHKGTKTQSVMSRLVPLCPCG
jgi:hypothetical protein